MLHRDTCHRGALLAQLD
ncbi:hypothetical protein LINGRAHAP2_LOCUS6832 [Linum grandiflorum]